MLNISLSITIQYFGKGNTNCPRQQDENLYSSKLQFSFQDYSTEGMNDGLLIFLQHLREFGLVYQRKVSNIY